MARDTAPLRVGIVGAGRTRQGLGPYLAAACEAAGARVTAVSGRDLDSARRVAGELGSSLGHAVAAAADAHELAHAVDALVVAAPATAHEVGLRAALDAGVACLCEKPLLPFAERLVALDLVRAFAERGLLLVENCQWPLTLPALQQLHPSLRGRTVRTVAMGLSPSGCGRAMIEDSLSHLLSVVQELAPLDAGSRVHGVSQQDGSATAEHNRLVFTIETATGTLQVVLQLDRCPQPPRPAWLELDGLRGDRHIGAGYAQSFVGGARSVPFADPLRALVARFVDGCRAPDAGERARQADRIAVRATLGAAVLAAL